MQYLKKKRMYEIAMKVCDLDCDIKLSQCHYRFHRGSEWLEFTDYQYIYKLYSRNCGDYLTLESFYYDDDLWKRVSVSCKVLNGFGKCEFPINLNAVVQ